MTGLLFINKIFKPFFNRMLNGNKITIFHAISRLSITIFQINQLYLKKLLPLT